MATTRTTRKRTTRRPTTPSRRTAPRKGFSANQMLKDAETPLVVGAGVVVGKVVHDLITRGATVAGLGDTQDGTKATSLLKPAILIAAGLALPQFTKNKYAANVGAGVALYGGVVAAKNYAGKDVLGSMNPDRAFSMPRILGLGLGNTTSLRLPPPPAGGRILGVGNPPIERRTQPAAQTHIL